MKVKSAAVIEPKQADRKRLLDGLKRAGLKAHAAEDVGALAGEQLVVLGPSVPQPAKAAQQVKRALPEALLLAAQRKPGKAAYADGVLPLPLSVADLKVRLPELIRLRAHALAAAAEPVAKTPASPTDGPARSPGEGILDPFTGFYTFAHFKEVLFVEVKRARRYGFPLSLGLAAFDPLPPEVALDPKLRSQLFGGLAIAIRRSLRDTDYPVQYSTDRVLTLMPHTNLQGALVVSRRIVERVARATLTHGDTVIHPTLSVGIASAGAQGAEVSFSDIARQAQLMLEEALRTGGNKALFWDAVGDGSVPVE